MITEHNFFSKRIPDFENDRKIGSIGEMDFKNHFPYNLIDISDDLFFVKQDIDFIMPKRKWKSNAEFIQYLKENEDFNACIKYEVKTDTISLITRNFFFETLCFWKTGCNARSIADWIYYVLIDDEYEIKERYLINNDKWKKWIEKNKDNQLKVKKPKIDKIKSEGKDGYLCRIDEMLKDKICYSVKINEKGKLETEKFLKT